MGCGRIAPLCIDAESYLVGDFPGTALESLLDGGDTASFPRIWRGSSGAARNGAVHPIQVGLEHQPRRCQKASFSWHTTSETLHIHLAAGTLDTVTWV